jgi:hypothetical protein
MLQTRLSSSANMSITVTATDALGSESRPVLASPTSLVVSAPRNGSLVLGAARAASAALMSSQGFDVAVNELGEVSAGEAVAYPTR